ncbi:calponin domain-containing protein [Fimicolochytrium jonesii]|uniref:calponin domain-containing protein n=1 Tax=Fimicolochytrium jonesii TaxID=1396493 RepID=UPI0022FECC1B|nr:calponin domain-containing protein [Fimicolochytrium jonesii]KAI8822005.1 calponin homology domain-containing protein [Fimicolochytrium jonesii]
MAHQYQDVALSPVANQKEGMEREIDAYAEHIRNMLADVEALRPKYIPITKDNFFENLQDGAVLAYIVNTIKPKTINIAKINTSIDPAHLNSSAATKGNTSATPEQTKGLFEATNNLNIVIEAAKNVAVVVNVAAEDFLRKKPDLVLGIIWQLIRAHLLSDINVPSHPELIRLLQPGESLTQLMAFTNEQLLLRWFNYHLERAGTDKRVANFGKDVSDSHAYMLLLQQVAPTNKRNTIVDALNAAFALPADDKEARARALLDAAETLGCRRFVTASDVAHGHARLNLAFAATIFDRHIGIHLPSEEEARALLDRNMTLEADNAILRSKVIELEKSVFALSQEVDVQKNLYEDTVRSFESKLATDTTTFQHSMEELRATQSKESESHASTISQLQNRFEALKQDQARAETSQNVYRQLVSDRLGAVRSMLQDHIVAVRQEGSLAAKLGSQLGVVASPTRHDAPPLPLAVKEAKTMEDELEFLSEDLKSFVKEVLDENKEQKKIITVLATRAEQHEKINSLMGEKIKSYTEHVIALNPVKEKKHHHHHKEEKHKEEKGKKEDREFVKLKS